MRPDLERQYRRIAGIKVVRQRGLDQDAKRGKRRTCGYRIGGIGRDQKRRIITAPHRALEAARDLDAEQHLAGRQEIVELLDVMNFLHEMKIGRVLQRLQDRAAEIAVFLQEHRGRQVVRRGVDRIPKQQELHHRDHDDHRERNAVTPQLDELLDDHRIAATPEAEARLPDLALMISFARHAHWKLSLVRVISSMNTSSSDGSLASQCNPLPSRHGAMLASSAARSRPDTCRLLPNGAIMSIPGRPARRSCTSRRSSPVTVYVESADFAITSCTVPCVSRWP